MTIIQIVLFITILSSFGEYKGIHCTNETINIYLSLNKSNLDSFQRRCYHAMFIYIYKELYKTKTNKNIQDEINAVADYYLRLLRIHGSYYDFKIIKPIDINTWTYFIQYTRWIKLINYNANIPESEKQVQKRKILDKARDFIRDGISRNAWNNVNLDVAINIKLVIEDFNYCQVALSDFSEPTIYVDKEINKQVLSEKTTDEIIEWCETVTKFGYIMHLMNFDEMNELISNKNNIIKQKLIIIRVMKIVLNRIYDGIITLLSEINSYPLNDESFNKFLENDNEVANQLTVMKRLYMNAINTTEAIYGIDENDSGQNDLTTDQIRSNKYNFGSEVISLPTNEYTYFIQYFQTKFQTLCSNCFKYTITINSDKFWTRYNAKYGSVSVRDRFFKVYRSSITNLSLNPRIFGFYKLFWLPGWVNREIEHTAVISSLQFNEYLVILHAYADWFMKDQSLQRKGSLVNLKNLYKQHRDFFPNESLNLL